MGVIVIDLGVPDTPPYYRLDPERFPDVLSMATKVSELTGAYLMPNLKPTGIATAACPACSFPSSVNYPTDGKASDGQIDASSVSSCNAFLFPAPSFSSSSLWHLALSFSFWIALLLTSLFPTFL